MPMRRAFAFIALALGVVAPPATLNAESNPRATLTEITRVSQPTDIASRSGDSGLYITQQDGLVVRFDTKTKTKSTALDLTDFTGASGERGLLGIVFHPNGRFMFVNYTDAAGDTVVARYRMRNNGTAITTTRVVLFTLDQPYSNHNGGGLAFGPGKRLYIGTGDGGSGGDPQRRALNRKSLLGKIISVDPLARSARGASPRIWSIGLRNPWRFEFDDRMNLWVADVGQNDWEEVSVAWATKGSGRNANFGWSAYEGLVRYNADQTATNHLKPVHVYKHGDEGCSISGGTKVRAKNMESLAGWYVFGDYCSGHITAIKVVGTKTTRVVRLIPNAGSVTAVRSVASGDVYVLELGGRVSALSAR